jgi:hypothetical protein
LTTLNRREFILGFGAFPFFWRKRTVSIAGVKFKIVRGHGKSLRRYLHIHGNERTAREVLLEHMKTMPGMAHLVQSDERYVPILGGKIDPNRMFSRVGAEKNLKSQNPGWDDAQMRRALDLLDKDRSAFVRAIEPPKGGILICLHNNGPGYSVKDEVPISDLTSLANPDHPREFMLCTDPRDFEVLRKSPFNVVLQEKAPPEDDGSLSRLAARMKFRYMNIESPHGNADAQRAMLAWAEKNIL